MHFQHFSTTASCIILPHVCVTANVLLVVTRPWALHPSSDSKKIPASVSTVCHTVSVTISVKCWNSKNLKDADFSCLKLIAATGVLKKSIRQCNYFEDPPQHEIIATAPKMSKAPGTDRMLADCWQNGSESTNVRTTWHILTYLDMSFRMFLY